MLKLVILALLSTAFFANELKIASYNVENLFDLKKDGREYREYIPNTRSNWNKKTFNKKLQNTKKVIKAINADIIALQEIENESTLLILKKLLPQYKYHSFTKYKNSSVGLGFLSKVKILENKNINVKFHNKIYRPIQENTFLYKNIKFKVFNNHWPSKRTSESYRIKYAKRLKDRLEKLPKDYDYILLGDFNSNYDEKNTIYHEKKLNDSSGITGINHVLKTSINNKFITKQNILKQKQKNRDSLINTENKIIHLIILSSPLHYLTIKK